MDLLPVSLGLIALLFVLIGLGVWIAVALATMGFVAIILQLNLPPGTDPRHHLCGKDPILGSHGFADVHPDGPTSFSARAFRRTCSTDSRPGWRSCPVA